MPCAVIDLIFGYCENAPKDRMIANDAGGRALHGLAMTPKLGDGITVLPDLPQICAIYGRFHL